MVCIIINGERIPNQDILVDTLKQNIEGLKTIVLNINKKTTNVIMEKKLSWRRIYIRLYRGFQI